MVDFDSFIEVDDNDIFMGDQHLKIQSTTSVTERKDNKDDNDERVTSKKNTKIDDDDLIDSDDFTIPEEETEEDVVVKKVEKPKLTKEEDTDEEEEEKKTPENLNEFSVFGSVLSDKGFFPDLDDEELSSVEDEDDLSDRLAKQLNITFSKWQDIYKQNLVANLTKEGYISKDSIQDKLPVAYTEDEIKSDLDVAKKVIRNYYKKMGTPPKEIERIINSREDLEESALELNQLNMELDIKENASLAAKLKQQEEQAIKQRQQFNEELRKNTFDYQEFIPGRKLKKQDKDEVFLNIEPTLQKINSNLAKYGPLLSYLDKYGMLDGKFDKVIKEGKTQGISSLQQILTERKKGNSINPQVRREGVINIDDSTVPKIYR